jgi:hypothetical protein
MTQRNKISCLCFSLYLLLLFLPHFAFSLFILFLINQADYRLYLPFIIVNSKIIWYDWVVINLPFAMFVRRCLHHNLLSSRALQGSNWSLRSYWYAHRVQTEKGKMRWESWRVSIVTSNSSPCSIWAKSQTQTRLSLLAVPKMASWWGDHDNCITSCSCPLNTCNLVFKLRKSHSAAV